MDVTAELSTCSSHLLHLKDYFLTLQSVLFKYLNITILCQNSAVFKLIINQKRGSCSFDFHGKGKV